MQERDDELMRIALGAASEAAALGEVPVGACLVDPSGAVLAVASNRTISSSDPTAHAEIIALRNAAARIGNYRLTGSTLYSTIEPCVMCAGALVNARVRRLVYGARDERFGAAESVFRLCDNPALNHRMEIMSGVLEEKCRRLMQDFFAERRRSTSGDGRDRNDPGGGLT
jgi:tRNA(adenine34) deaminase